MDQLFYRKPRLLVLTLFLILVSGLSAYQILPRLEDPEISQRWALIITPAPGADAERVEALVTDPIEEEILELSEIRRTFSNSRTGISVIRVIIKDEVDDVPSVWTRIRDKLDTVEPLLPAGVGAPELKTDGLRAYTLIAGLSWRAPTPPSYGLLRRLGEELEARLSRVPGTQYVDLAGIPEEEVLVAADPQRLAALSLSSADLAEAIQGADAKVSAGLLRDATQNLPLEVSGEFQSLERLRRIPIQVDGGARTVPLQELAEVQRTVADPPGELALISGRPGLAVAARMLPDQRVDLWATKARAVVDEMRAELPPGLELELLFDQSRYTDARLLNLQLNLVLGGLLVVLVVLIMMGWKSALLVGSSLPLASLMVLEGMQLLGIPMHQMSVTGLIIALGLLIDNAIVIVDEVRTGLREGDRSPEAIGAAISKAVRHLAVPLLGSTLTTVLAFMPLVLMPGGAGEFVGAIAVTVILALVSSLFLALTVVPALTGFVERLLPDQGRGWLTRGISSPRLSQLGRRGLDLLFARPWIGVVIGLILPTLGFIRFGELREQFFPPADRDQFQVALRLPPQASSQLTLETAAAARELILSDDRVEAVHWFIGRNAPMYYYNLVPGQDGSPFYAQALVQLDGPEESGAVIRRLQRRLDEAFPEAQFIALQLEQGPPFEAPVELRLLGPDLDVLHDLGEQVRAILAQDPEVTHTRATLTVGLPKLSLELDEDRARISGLQPVTIARQLDASLEGRRAGSLLEMTEELPVRVRLGEGHRGDVNRIASQEVLSQGRRIALSSLGSLTVVPERGNVFRYLGRRCNAVQAYLQAGVLPAAVLARLEARLDEVPLPDGYSYEIGGESAERDDAVGNLMASVSILMVLMAATLVLSFSSFRMAGIIATVALASIGLGLFALALGGYPFGFMAIVGTMGLVGVAINDAIVVLAAIREHPVARTGDKEAVRDVILASTRHVLSTTFTTIVGFIPLLLDGGGFWPPLAVAIAGGVAGATLLALTYVPALYLILMCRSCAAAAAPEASRSASTRSVPNLQAVGK